jgi:SAM-dependent methyltransferase
LQEEVNVALALPPAATVRLEAAEPGRLDAVRALLSGAGFTEEGVCRRLEISSIYDFRSIREGRETAVETRDRLDLLIRLFMDVELIDRSQAGDVLSPDAADTLESLGLLTRYHSDRSRCHATVLLYPTGSLWIISDLNVSPAGPAATSLPEDAVYPAITGNTRHFLSSLPSTPCDSFLELCAGTGIAALRASRYARRTWAADITERATSFARFNAALNGIENCTAVRGDLYEPVAGRRFDRIVAHPPYMPSLEQKYIFRDGGEDGEQITRRIIAGLPGHLGAAGRFYCTCMLTDRKGARAEARIRAMLGERGDEFDVVVVELKTFQPTEYYVRLALAGRATLDEVARRHEIFARLEVEQLVYCSMVVQRRATGRPPFTCRRQAGPDSGVDEVEWLMRWEEAVAGSDPTDWLLEARPKASPGARMRLLHVMRDGGWVVDECLLTTSFPFVVEAKCPPWVATLMAGADGGRTTLDHLDFLKQGGALPQDAPKGDFARLVRSFIAGGFLEVREHPLPAARLSPVPAAT